VHPAFNLTNLKVEFLKSDF